MKKYQLLLYILKLIILILIVLMSLKIIKIKNDLYIVIDAVFKLSMGLFIIIFFSRDKNDCIDSHDRLLIVISGFILILLINFTKVIDIICNYAHKVDSELD